MTEACVEHVTMKQNFVAPIPAVPNDILGQLTLRCFSDEEDVQEKGSDPEKQLSAQRTGELLVERGLFGKDVQ